MDISIIFPNQIFEKSKLLYESSRIYLIEEFLFFNQFKFHKQKILFHRMTMKSYERFLQKNSFNINYINSTEKISEIKSFIENLDSNIKSIKIYDPVDNWLSKRINDTCKLKNINVEVYDNPLFINKNEDLSSFFRIDKKKFFQTSFYKQQRLKLDVMMIGDKPEGGKWTYDGENSKKIPKTVTPPPILKFKHTNHTQDERENSCVMNIQGKNEKEHTHPHPTTIR